MGTSLPKRKPSTTCANESKVVRNDIKCKQVFYVSQNEFIVIRFNMMNRWRKWILTSINWCVSLVLPGESFDITAWVDIKLNHIKCLCVSMIMPWHRHTFSITGGRFKNTYELLNLRALKFSPVNKIHIFQCMGMIFCVEFQRYPLKFHSKYLTHTLKDVTFMQHWNFKSS